MDDHNLSLADYHDLLDAAFPAATMPSDLREAALQEFTDFARSKKLSISEAAYILKDQRSTEKLKAKVRQAASKVDALSPKLTAEETVKEAILKLCIDVDFVKAAVINFTELGMNTKSLVSEIGQSVTETKASTADSKKTIEEIHAAAAHLQEVLTQAADKTNIIVEKMETIPPRLDAQLQKIEGLEKSVEAAEKNSDEAKKNTDPDKTHKENVKIMWHSVFWSTLAGSICGTGLGFLVSTFATKPQTPLPAPTKTIERIIEKPADFPQVFILKDEAGKRIGTVEVAPIPDPPAAGLREKESFLRGNKTARSHPH